MRYRTLGSTGIRVSIIGFGSWGIGGRTPGETSYGATDDAVSRRALEAASERGITLFDTANVYGNGHSETLIGDVFHARRSDVVIATKAGMLPSFSGLDFSAAALRRSLEGSLRRLKTDYVDVLQLHNPPPDDIRKRAEILETLETFRREGKIRAFGLSTKTPDEAKSLIATPNLACVQVNLNLLDWRALDNGLLAESESLGVGVIARTPLAFGFLSGAITADATFPPGDHRSRWSRAKLKLWLAAADDIMSAAADGRLTRAQTALRFCASFASVASVIPGMLTEQEVETNAAAGDCEPFTPQELAGLKQVYVRYETDLAA